MQVTDIKVTFINIFNYVFYCHTREIIEPLSVKLIAV